MIEYDADEMRQLVIDGRIITEWKDGTIYVLDHREGVEVNEG